MPSQEPNVQEQGFRTSFMGFDKNDVLAYINAQDNEYRQREFEYQEQIKQLQAQVDKLKKDQSSARICVEKLQDELKAAGSRAETAEAQAQQAAQKAEAAEQKAAEAEEQQRQADTLTNSFQIRCKEYQKTITELQFKGRDLQKRVDELEAAAQLPAPAAPETPRPEPAPAAPAAPLAADLPEDARIEARKILADARLYAEGAEKRLRQQEEDQKNRMTESARCLAAGVLLLRERLARVDEKLSAASLDLENATGAIYQALDQADSELDSLGAGLRRFPETPAPVGQPPKPAAPARSGPLRPKAKATAQPVKARPARQPAPADGEPARRLRRAAPRRTVSQDLLDAMHRLEKE